TRAASAITFISPLQPPSPSGALARFPTRRSSDLFDIDRGMINLNNGGVAPSPRVVQQALQRYLTVSNQAPAIMVWGWLEPEIERSEEHTSELQSPCNIVCRLLLEKKTRVSVTYLS